VWGCTPLPGPPIRAPWPLFHVRGYETDIWKWLWGWEVGDVVLFVYCLIYFNNAKH